jgi:hypothetical protein
MHEEFDNSITNKIDNRLRGELRLKLFNPFCIVIISLLSMIHCNTFVHEEIINEEKRTPKIAILEAGTWKDSYERVLKNSKYNISSLPQNSTYEDFKQFDCVWLPSSWAELSSIDTIQSRSSDLKNYIGKGGNLLIGQPNPYGQIGDTIRPDFLPYEITFNCGYDKSDLFSEVVDTNHFITKNIGDQSRASPADMVTFSDTNYHILIRGIGTKTPSLLVTEMDSTRVVIITANTGWPNGFPISDTLLFRIMDWLTYEEK